MVYAFVAMPDLAAQMVDTVHYESGAHAHAHGAQEWSLNTSLRDRVEALKQLWLLCRYDP